MTTVGRLIEELKKYPQDSEIGYYPNNAHGRGCAWRITRIEDVEFCDDGKTVAIVGGYE